MNLMLKSSLPKTVVEYSFIFMKLKTPTDKWQRPGSVYISIYAAIRYFHVGVCG